jgi:HipA-like kinase
MLTTVSARKFFYKLCGSSQPSIIEASDGSFYVVKFNGFPGHRSLANEIMGTELIRSIGLPAPDWVAIEISDSFIDENPGLWFCKADSFIKPLPGLHFGSRLIETSEDQCTYQMIPHSWLDRIENRADFLGVLVLDLWANNCDRRQTVFLRDAQNRLHATFIDNDFMFGGKFGFEITCPRRAMVYDLDLYRGLWGKESVQKWIRIIDGIGENAIRQIAGGMPDEWADEDLRLDIVEQLIARRSMLPRLLAEAEDVLNSGYSVKYHRTRYATEPSQFRNAPIFPALR